MNTLKTKIAYRPDIDGLRALAVMLVLLFHFDLGVSGGFVGVDVFFVISGYLITEVIKGGCASGRFSFVDFYARRLTRLHPALIATVACCLIAGGILMDPASFASLAASAGYAVFSASNFFFWNNSGYFDASAHTQPLLHTWSLAAEWQFYLVWPVVVWASLKVSERFLVWLLVALTAASLLASQYMLTVDATAAYFLVPFRMFELAIGGFMVFAGKYRARPLTESGLLWLGLALIVGSALLLDATSAFPGWNALAPCIGAALCIHCGRAQAGAVLRAKPVVWIGLISYSVYLVHWPIAVFYKYFIFRDISLVESVSLCAASILAGWAMYTLVETRFMPARVASNRARYATSVALAVVMYTASWYVVTTNGMPQRINQNYVVAESDPATYRTERYGGYGYPLDGLLGKQDGLDAYILGDSFSLQYASGLDTELKPKGIALLGLFTHGCFLSGQYTRLENNQPRRDCFTRYRQAMTMMANDNKPMIFALHWTGYKDILVKESGEKVTFDNDTEFEKLIFEAVQSLRADAGSRPLIIVGSQPFLSADKSVAECLLRPAYLHQPCNDFITYPPRTSETFRTNKAIKQAVAGMDATHFVDPATSLCPQGICGPTLDGKLIYSDNTHLSIDGSAIAGSEIARLLESVMPIKEDG
ncbi:acyltransferase family protein [Pseudomonas sp. BP8]|uniref:acyltransferase family protein n=1 Tax=Pseudomonas sp. BP8 TaxID=2817864 RepID=UPI001AE90A50|nr:acyltransferase family protein [Pseudomonas sp. BP8]MBP2262618.1 peptidoglycan/LPS O-acetylase OafA/YrhL [Pseudomonas sp. BP8]HDS1734663.1 acyltransferase [Pseudomonas putida]